MFYYTGGELGHIWSLYLKYLFLLKMEEKIIIKTIYN